MSSLNPNAEFTTVEKYTEAPTQSVFEMMDSRHDYLAPGADPVFSDVSPITYEFTPQEDSEYGQICENAYKYLMESEEQALELFSSPLGEEAMADAIGIGSCETDMTANDVSSIVYKDNSESSYSIGCSSVAVNTAMSLTMQNQLKCTMISTYNQIINNQSSVQNLTIGISDSTFQGDVSITGSQTSVSDVQFVNVTDVNVKSSLSNQLETNINQLQEAVQESIAENTTIVSQGQKSYQSVVNAICNSAYSLNIQDLVSQSINDICEVQDNVLYISGSLFEGDVNIDMSQELFMNTVIENVVNNVTQEIMVTAGLATITTDQSSDQSKIVKGGGSGSTTVLFGLSIAAVLCCIMPFFRKDPNIKTNHCRKVIAFSAIVPTALFIWAIITWILNGGGFALTSWILNLVYFCWLAYVFFRLLPLHPEMFACSGDETSSLIDQFKVGDTSSATNSFLDNFKKLISKSSKAPPISQSTSSTAPLLPSQTTSSTAPLLPSQTTSSTAPLLPSQTTSSTAKQTTAPQTPAPNTAKQTTAPQTPAPNTAKQTTAPPKAPAPNTAKQTTAPQTPAPNTG